MIGLLRGRVAAKQPPGLLLDVQGVGFELETSMNTFYRLPEIGAEVELLTHLVVREDAQLLYGFAGESERELFRALIRISGIGAKLALAILSGMEADEFRHCIESGDAERLTRLPGIGKKTAERLVVELRDRLGDWQGSEPVAARRSTTDPVNEAVSALIGLGYKSQEASRMVRNVAETGADSATLIRAALKAAVA